MNYEYIYFILRLHTIYTFAYLISVALLQNDQSGEHIQKRQTFFVLFCRIQIYRTFTKSTQATNSWQKCLW